MALVVVIVNWGGKIVIPLGFGYAEVLARGRLLSGRGLVGVDGQLAQLEGGLNC